MLLPGRAYAMLTNFLSTGFPNFVSCFTQGLRLACYVKASCCGARGQLSIRFRQFTALQDRHRSVTPSIEEPDDGPDIRHNTADVGEHHPDRILADEREHRALHG